MYILGFDPWLSLSTELWSLVLALVSGLKSLLTSLMEGCSVCNFVAIAMSSYIYTVLIGRRLNVEC